MVERDELLTNHLVKKTEESGKKKAGPKLAVI